GRTLSAHRPGAGLKRQAKAKSFLPGCTFGTLQCTRNIGRSSFLFGERLQGMYLFGCPGPSFSISLNHWMIPLIEYSGLWQAIAALECAQIKFTEVFDQQYRQRCQVS